MIRLEHKWKPLCCKLLVVVRLRLELGMEWQVDLLARCLTHLVGRQVLEGGGTINAQILIRPLVQVGPKLATTEPQVYGDWSSERNIMCIGIEVEDDPFAY